MSSRAHEQLTVALIDADIGRPPGGESVRQLATALEERGYRVSVLQTRPIDGRNRSARWRRFPAAVLDTRGFTQNIDRLPMTIARLLTRRYDLVHAFSAPDAVAGLWWRRLTGRPVVFTWSETARRDGLADRRLRLRAVQKATADADSFMAASASVREGLWRWLALEPAVLPVHDIAAHDQLYRQLVRQA